MSTTGSREKWEIGVSIREASLCFACSQCPMAPVMLVFGIGIKALVNTSN